MLITSAVQPCLMFNDEKTDLKTANGWGWFAKHGWKIYEVPEPVFLKSESQSFCPKFNLLLSVCSLNRYSMYPLFSVVCLLNRHSLEPPAPSAPFPAPPAPACPRSPPPP